MQKQLFRRSDDELSQEDKDGEITDDDDDS